MKAGKLNENNLATKVYNPDKPIFLCQSYNNTKTFDLKYTTR